MLRVKNLFVVSKTIHNNIKSTGIVPRYMTKQAGEFDEGFDARYEAFFNNPKIDGWDIRKAMNDLCGMDLIADPKVTIAALRACRRIHDYALAVRFLETLKFKCRTDSNLYPYLLQEITATLEELGIDTPEKLGYDKLELALSNVYDIH